MKTTFLGFEQPVAELENRIEELRYAQDDPAAELSEEIQRLSKKSAALTKEIYAKLTPWQVAQVARHPQRPYTLDYVQMLFGGFEELHGDRSFADDQSIVGGLARFDGTACMVIGHQKGRDTKEKILRNFGMSRPEGYRKALRLMKLAEKFGIPLFTFVDTRGAYPGVGAEERGQWEAIGRNLYAMAELRVPIVCTVIGEGGSGGGAPSKPQTSTPVTEKELDDAIEQAHGSIETLLQAMLAPKPSYDFLGLKIRFSTQDGGYDGNWVEPVDYYDGKFTVRMMDSLTSNINLQTDRTLQVPLKKVVDWMSVEKDGTLIGGYTIRLAYEHMSPDEKKEFLRVTKYKLK